MRRVRLSSRNGCFFCMPPAGEPCAPLFDVAGAILGRILGTILALGGTRVAAGIGDPLDGSSRLDFGERSFDPLPVMPPLQICRRLKLGAGQRVEDAKFRQRQPVIEAVGNAPQDAS